MLLIATALISACANSGEAVSRDGAVIQMTGYSQYPSANLEDWKSYADFVAIVQVREVKVLPVDVEFAAADEPALQERRVVVDVKETVWKHETFGVVPASIEFVGLPNIVKADGKIYPAGMDSVPGMEAGDVFMTPFLTHSDGSVIPINLDTMIPILDGLLSPTQPTTEATAELNQISIQQFNDVFSKFAALPIAEQNRHLTALERAELVYQESKYEPGEGEMAGDGEDTTTNSEPVIVDGGLVDGPADE
jgi:hypothetical protein